MTLTNKQMQKRNEDLCKLNGGIFFKTDERNCQYWYKILEDGSLQIGYQVYLNSEPVFKDGDDGFYLTNQEELVRLANTNKSWFQVVDKRSSWHW